MIYSSDKTFIFRRRFFGNHFKYFVALLCSPIRPFVSRRSCGKIPDAIPLDDKYRKIESIRQRAIVLMIFALRELPIIIGESISRFFILAWDNSFQEILLFVDRKSLKYEFTSKTSTSARIKALFKLSSKYADIIARKFRDTYANTKCNQY